MTAFHDRCRTLSGRRAMVLVTLASLGVPTVGGAQTASQITPPTYAPPVPRPQTPIVLPQSTANAAPPGSEALEIRLADVVVEGGEGGAAEQDRLAALKGRLVGSTIKVADIFAAARDLETAYARDGHVLTRVVVPAQQLDDGATLRLSIVEGFVERIDTSQVPARVRSRVAKLLDPLVNRHDVTLAMIERRLLLAADTPGVTLKSALTAGSTPGATVLVVDAVWRPVSGFVAFDNTLPDSLGRSAFGLGLDFNSVLGLGETVYLRASGLPNGGRRTSILEATPRNRALAAGLIIPLGSDGLALNIEGTDARTAPRHDAALPGFGSRFQRLTGRLSYPVIRSRALTFSAQLSFDALSERVRVITPAVLPLSLDRLRIARAAGSLVALLPTGGTLSTFVEGSFGIAGLGARTAADASPQLPLSRAGSDADFQKATLDLSFDQPFGQHVGVAVKARAQTSFGQALANAEQIGIAASDGISPLPSGSLQGDAGYVVRGELRSPWQIGFGGGQAQIAPYAFGAIGGVRLEQPSTLERRETGAHAWGAGLRLSGSAWRDGRPALSTSLEYGRAGVGGLPHDTDRVIFTIIGQF